MIVGIDASRNRSGGAKTHLIGLLEADEPARHGVSEVHVWSYRALLDALPDKSWLKKHNPPALEMGLIRQVFWQRFRFPAEARNAGCSIVLNTDAGTLSSFDPAVTMSRDMLSFEPGEIDRFGIGRARLRLLALRHVQANSLRRSAGVIFLTRHAEETITRFTGPLKRVARIPHGVGSAFRIARAAARELPQNGKPIRCLYVSNAARHKHQWVVVRAMADLRREGVPVELVLAGGGKGSPQAVLDAEIRRSDPRGVFVRQLGAVPHSELPGVLAQADIFLFASTCENMPNTLLEAMAAGLPIASSDRGPMPEVLKDGGIYFDPENPESIGDSVRRLAADRDLRDEISRRARELSGEYTWRRCAENTWRFLVDTAQRSRA